MGVRSTGSHPTTTKADGHLLEYFRQNFLQGGGGTEAPPPAPLQATGGVVSDYPDGGSNIYRAHVFTSSSTFNVTSLSTGPQPNAIEYLVVAGGGGTGGRGNRLRTDDGYIDYNAIYAYNNSTSGAGGNFAAEGGYITRASANYHNWFGLVSNYETQLSDNLSFNVGLDVRTYQGEHYRHVVNFHGLTSWQENIRLKDHTNNHQNLGTYGTYKFAFYR